MSKFEKGKSGNPKGRPKKVDNAKKFLTDRGDDIRDNAKTALEALLEKAIAEGNADEVKEISKILIGYQVPRISSIDSEEDKVTEVTVSWGIAEEASEDHPMKKLLKGIKDGK